MCVCESVYEVICAREGVAEKQQQWIIEWGQSMVSFLKELFLLFAVVGFVISTPLHAMFLLFVVLTLRKYCISFLFKIEQRRRRKNSKELHKCGSLVNFVYAQNNNNNREEKKNEDMKC